MATNQSVLISISWTPILVFMHLHKKNNIREPQSDVNESGEGI